MSVTKCTSRLRAWTPNSSRWPEARPWSCALRRAAVFRGDLAPGTYRVTLAKQGYGSKLSVVELGGEPVSFRLLPDKPWATVAQVGAERRILAVPRAWRGAVSPFAVAIRLEEGIHRGHQFDRRAWPAGQSPDPSRWRFHADGREVERRRLPCPARDSCAGAERALLHPCPYASNDFFSFPW